MDNLIAFWRGGEAGMEYVLGGMLAGIVMIVAAETFLYA